MNKFTRFLTAALLAGAVGAPLLVWAQLYDPTTGLLIPGTAPGQAISANTTPQTIQQLEQLIQVLTVQLNTLRQLVAQRVASQPPGVRLSGELTQGDRSDDVRTLQEFLATDPTIYPEGLVTGFYGPLTAQAVSRFQQRYGTFEEGQVGPQTMVKINQILQEGAGSSGQVPPGLLVSPGIRAKFEPGFTPQPLPGQTLPPGISNQPGVPTGSISLPITISGLSASNVTSSSAQINWMTDQTATGQVWYSTGPVTFGSGTPTVTSSDMSTSHSIILNGLTPGVLYYYIAASTNAAGTVTSAQQTFMTPQATTTSGTTVPMISNVVVSEVSRTAARITWTTDVAADSKVWFSSATPVTANSTTSNASMSDQVTNHSVQINGLNPGTTYYYIVTSGNSAGTASGSQQVFSTPQ